MQMVNRNMVGIVSALDRALATNNLEKVPIRQHALNCPVYVDALSLACACGCGRIVVSSRHSAETHDTLRVGHSCTELSACQGWRAAYNPSNNDAVPEHRV